MSILLVMSDDMDARLTAYLLGQTEQQVVVTATVREARRYLHDRSWSAVVLDTTLADGSGFDLLDVLSALHFDGGILVLSASREVADKVHALEAGADDFVTRPYEPAELLARVKALLRRSHRSAGTAHAGDGGTIRVGGVELDVNALTVTLPGNRRERLTPNELRLLHYLMTHAGRVVDHQELLACLFGTQDHQASSNAVGVYMRRVRRKIEDDPDQPRHIVTVRGSGYRFETDEDTENAPADSDVTHGDNLLPQDHLDKSSRKNHGGKTPEKGGAHEPSAARQSDDAGRHHANRVDYKVVCST